MSGTAPPGRETGRQAGAQQIRQSGGVGGLIPGLGQMAAKGVVVAHHAEQRHDQQKRGHAGLVAQGGGTGGHQGFLHGGQYGHEKLPQPFGQRSLFLHFARKQLKEAGGGRDGQQLTEQTPDEGADESHEFGVPDVATRPVPGAGCRVWGRPPWSDAAPRL